MSEEDTVNKSSKALIETVGLNYRYASAWNEVNTRIAQRQNAVTIFVTLATVIVTVIHAAPRMGTELDPNVFSLLIPVVSLVFGLLHYKHDKTIALLREFLATCERHHLKQHPELSLPGYNSDECYRKYAGDARSFHDYSSAALIVIFNILGGYVAYHAYPEVLRFSGWPFVFYLIGCIASLYFVLRSTVRPHLFPALEDTF